MLRACGKGLIVAMAGVAALMWFGTGPAAAQAQAPQTEPAFVRIAVSEKSFVYIQIQGGELRAATSVEGLQTAAPVKLHASSANALGHAAFPLPVPADQLPPGVTAIKASLSQAQGRNGSTGALMRYIFVEFIISRTDDQKVEWQYGSRGVALAGTDAENAPSIELPDLDKVKASVEARTANGQLGIGLRVNAGDAMSLGVRKDGQPVQVKMVIADASGAEVVSKVGPLSDFGFSLSGPRYSVGVAKGTYTCTATLDIGAGSPLKATTTAVVP